MNLASINTNFFGEPKIWIVIPPKFGHLLEKLVKELVLQNDALSLEYEDCNDSPLRHKSFILSPELLKKHQIPFNVIVQHVNETVITLPYAYHGGFNIGFNLAQATNIATPSWIPYAKVAKMCCKLLPILFDLGPFIKKYESDGSYADWKAGVEYKHPEFSAENPLHKEENATKSKQTHGQKERHLSELGCDYSTTRSDSFKKHLERKHKDKSTRKAINCNSCGKSFLNKGVLL